MLCDRGAPLSDIPMNEIGTQRLCNAHRIKAGMVVETFVLYTHKRILNKFGNIINGRPLHIFFEIGFVYDIAVHIIDCNVLSLFIQR